MRFLAFIAVLALASPALGGAWQSTGVNQVGTTFGTSPLTDYGCSTAPPVKSRAGAAAWIARRQFETHGQNGTFVISLGPAASLAPGSEWVTKWAGRVDALRNIRRDYASETIKPRIEFHGRSDLWRRQGVPDSDDPRIDPSGPGCPAGTYSHAGSGKVCTFGSVPICQGGTRDGYWCPDPDDDTYCPGGGACDLVAFDPTWVLTVPTAEHEAAVAELDHLTTSVVSDPINWDPDQLCDGTVGDDAGLDDTHCGTGYPDFADLTAALANLPADSIGHALATEQGVWPLTARPVYYGPALTEDGGEYTFRVNSFAMDLRLAAWREWSAATYFDLAYQSMAAAGFSEEQIRDWPVAFAGWHVKPGWEAYYTPHAGDSPTCVSNAVAETHMWDGPNRPVSGLDASQITACTDEGGPLHDTPYGPREFELATAALGQLILAQTGGEDDFFADVRATADDAPALRGKKNEALLAPLRFNPLWWGARHNALSQAEAPFNREKACRTPPVVAAGGPYIVASGGSIRLDGQCVAPGTTTPLWTVESGGTNCAFLDPFDDSADTGDPNGLLSGCTADGVIQLACGSTTATAIVDVQ